MLPVRLFRLCGYSHERSRRGKKQYRMAQSMPPMQSSDYEFLLRRPSAILETQFEVNSPIQWRARLSVANRCKHLVEQPFQCRNSLLATARLG